MSCLVLMLERRCVRANRSWICQDAWSLAPAVLLDTGRYTYVYCSIYLEARLLQGIFPKHHLPKEKKLDCRLNFRKVRKWFSVKWHFGSLSWHPTADAAISTANQSRSFAVFLLAWCTTVPLWASHCCQAGSQCTMCSLEIWARVSPKTGLCAFEDGPDCDDATDEQVYQILTRL